MRACAYELPICASLRGHSTWDMWRSTIYGEFTLLGKFVGYCWLLWIVLWLTAKWDWGRCHFGSLVLSFLFGNRVFSDLLPGRPSGVLWEIVGFWVGFSFPKNWLHYFCPELRPGRKGCVGGAVTTSCELV